MDSNSLNGLPRGSQETRHVHTPFGLRSCPFSTDPRKVDFNRLQAIPPRLRGCEAHKRNCAGCGVWRTGRVPLVYAVLLPPISFQSGAIAAAGSVYVLVAYMFAVRTWQEGQSSKGGGPAWRMVGLLLSAIWPIIIALAGFEALRRRSHGK
jgi:hypothetical protein